uniref:alanine--tRNA ligase n=1 Tax=Leersia perrieri TaxID=77586 RepID=A0A0D9XI94_9ORYZ
MAEAAAVREMVRSMGAERLDAAIRFATFELVGRDILLHDLLRLCDHQDHRRGMAMAEAVSAQPISDSSEESVIDLLRALQAVPMTFETLEKSKIGKTVTGLRKHPSEQVRSLAGELCNNWKALVNDHLTSSISKTKIAPDSAADHSKKTAAAAHKPAPAAAAAKKTTPNDRKEALAKLAVAKRKLEEGYKEAASAKKQRMIQVIDAPRKTNRRPIAVVERRRLAPVAAMPEDLQKIESIVNQQINEKLEVFAREIKLADAKRINGLRAVFGEIYPDPVRVVSVGRKVEDLLANPESKEWLSISTELCGGIFSCTIASIKGGLDKSQIPAARKADLKGRVSKLEDELRKAKKKMGEENIQKAVKFALDAAQTALSEGKRFCVAHVDVGLDTSAIREAVIEVKDQKDLPIMLFSVDEATNKAVIYADVPPSAGNSLKVLDWLTPSIAPLKGKGGGGKNGIAQGQGSDASQLKEAMELATKIASMKLA